MRVCQFRHFGTLSQETGRAADHGSCDLMSLAKRRLDVKLAREHPTTSGSCLRNSKQDKTPDDT